MGTITLNVDDETEALFRKTVKETLGEGKGKLGKAAAEALKKWAKDNSDLKARMFLKEAMKKGLYNSGGWKFNRDEIYDREISRK